jgi:uncharacterized protein HemX
MDTNLIEVVLAIIAVAGAAVAAVRAVTAQALASAAESNRQATQAVKEQAEAMNALSVNLNNHFQENRAILREITSQLSSLTQYMSTQTELIKLIMADKKKGE